MYYLITVYNDNGFTEILKMKKIDRELISLYRHCLGSTNNKNLLLSGMLLEWQDKQNDVVFMEVSDLVEKFEHLKSTDSEDDYMELKEYILNNYQSEGEE